MPLVRLFRLSSVAACLIGSSVAYACDPATNQQAVSELRQGIDQINDFMSALRNAGLPVPPALSGAVNELTWALQKGDDLAEAAGEVDAQVQEIVNNKNLICERAGDVGEGVDACLARIAHQYPYRNVPAVGAVFVRAAQKWLGSKCDDKKPGGIRVDVKPEGTTTDLSGVRSAVEAVKR
jgi:hypothetical protein